MAVQEIVKKLNDERQNLWGQQTELLDLADKEKRNLSGPENEQYEARDERINEIDERAKELLKQEERAREAEERFAALERTPQVPQARGGDDQLDTQFREFFKNKNADPIDLVFRHDRNTPYRRNAWGSSVEQRDTVVGTPNKGGYTVPVTFVNQLTEHMIEMSAILESGPTVWNTDGGEEMWIPKTTAHSTASRVAEATQIPQSDPIFGQVKLNAYKYSLLLGVSREATEDTGVDLQGYLARQAGQAVGNKFGEELMLGTNVEMPNGLVNAATVGLTGANGVGGAFTADQIIEFYYSVIGPYRKRPSCAWIMDDVTMGAVRKLKDNAGQYIWHPATDPGGPDTLLTKPVHTDPNTPIVGAGNRSILFGDMSSYHVRIVNGIRFERSDEYAFGRDVITYRCIIRGDGDLVDTSGAVKAFVGGTA